MSRAQKIEEAAKRFLADVEELFPLHGNPPRRDWHPDSLEDLLSAMALPPDETRMTATECVEGVKAGLDEAARTHPIEFKGMDNAVAKAEAIVAIAAPKCAFCGGQGWAVHPGNDCPVCNGTGRAPGSPT